MHVAIQQRARPGERTQAHGHTRNAQHAAGVLRARDGPPGTRRALTSEPSVAAPSILSGRRRKEFCKY